MSRNVLELFGVPTSQADADWGEVVSHQHCPYLDKICVKTRKSQPEVAIGTCSVTYGAKGGAGVIICPHRLLERKQIFMDCIHLLTLHEPGNELHKIAEVEVPGGSVDYVLVSVKDGKVADFVGIELQALDTTGTLWPQRQSFLREVGVEIPYGSDMPRPYGMNWKMTAKTILVQLHHKTETFQQLNKHLVLVLQESLLDYMKSEFSFGHVQNARLGDPMHFHSYSLKDSAGTLRLSLESRLSTDSQGVAACLGLQVSANIELEVITATLQSKLSSKTLLTI